MINETVLDLKAGDRFSLSSRRNAKTYVVSKRAENPVEQIGTGRNWSIRPDNPHIGKYLVICANCEQLILEKERQIWIRPWT